MKIAFSFFLLIYSRCGALASWAARHTIVCLDLLLLGRRQLQMRPGDDQHNYIKGIIYGQNRFNNYRIGSRA